MSAAAGGGGGGGADDEVAAEDGSGGGVDDVVGEKETKSNNEDVANNASSPLGDLISSPLFYVTFGIVGGVAIVQYFENAALLLSAFPIVGLTLLSKTDFGTELEDAILEQRPALEAAAAEVRERERENVH